ncbi:MAG: hypothetical protein SRB2_04215, partial [Desulfobacteraceae bacterium Eth-SRB2]
MKSKRNISWKISVFALLFAVLAVISIGCASADTIYVPEGGNQTIQQAVNNATAGDTIIVRDAYTGTKENIDVSKSYLTIKSENGSVNCIVSASNLNDHVFNVTKDYVNISGFTVENATGNWKAGIYLHSVEHCNISYNNASNNDCGIELSSSSNNTLTNNTANSNNWDGIYLDYSSNNTLTNNTANSNNWDGILLYSSSNNTLTNNIMSENSYNFGVDGYMLSHYTHSIDTSNLVDGEPIYYWIDQQNKEVPGDAGFVGLVNSTNITVKDLTLTNNQQGVLLAYTKNSRIERINASNNDCGIELSSSSNNTLTNNTANSNSYDGIYMWSSSNNTLTNNTANSNNWDGIYLDYSSNNTFTNNTANSNNWGDGIYLDYSSNNTLTNNTANSNNWYGIYLDYSSNNTLTNNTANSNNWDGI